MDEKSLGHWVNESLAAGKVVAAIDFLRQIIRIQGDNAPARAALHRIYKHNLPGASAQQIHDQHLEQDELNKLLELEEQALATDPDSTAILQRLVTLCRQLNYSASTNLYQQLLKQRE